MFLDPHFFSRDTPFCAIDVLVVPRATCCQTSSLARMRRSQGAHCSRATSSVTAATFPRSSSLRPKGSAGDLICQDIVLERGARLHELLLCGVHIRLNEALSHGIADNIPGIAGKR